MGIAFRKAFRILGLGERKGRWVMEQDFHAGLTELCADFSEIMRNFFPNYAVKIANYAGIMRIAQYLL